MYARPKEPTHEPDAIDLRLHALRVRQPDLKQHPLGGQAE